MHRGSKMYGSQDRAREAGFSLVEILITLLIFSTITMGLLLVFDNSSRLARSQTQLAMLQQNQRVGHSELVRFVKMAGLGGLPLTLINPSDPQKTDAGRRYKEPGMFPRGFAIEVINNMEADRKIDALNTGASGSGDVVLEGSDVLIVRGVFSTPVYYVAKPALQIETVCTPTDNGKMCLTDSDKKIEGTLLIPAMVRAVDIAGKDLSQDLQPLSERLQAAKSKQHRRGFDSPRCLEPQCLCDCGPSIYRRSPIRWNWKRSLAATKGRRFTVRTPTALRSPSSSIATCRSVSPSPI